MIEPNAKTKWFELFRPGDFADVSPVFSFAKQVTIRAVGMLEDDVITLNLVKLSDGKFPQWCDCIPSPGEQPRIESTQPLVCPDCLDGEASAVRITPVNPIIILDAPQNTYLVAIYHGDGVGTASVMAQFGTTTDVSALTPAMRGCPECEYTPEPEPVYYATVELPDGGLAYRDGQQDPEATVEIRDCEDALVGWIYPMPTDGATTEVKTCDGDLLGYAVNGIKSSSQTPVVNNSTEVNIPSTIQISGMPGLQITSMPTVKLEVPRLAVSTLETHGDIWVLYNDGSLEKSSVRYPQDAEIEKTVLISFGGVAEDMVVRAGERFALPDVAGVTGWRLGEVIYSPGYTISRRYSTVFEAVY